MKTELLLENSEALCYEFYNSNSVEEKKTIGSRLIAYLEKNTSEMSGTINTTLSPVLQLHVDTYDRTKIKLKLTNLLQIVGSFFYEKEKVY